MERKSFEERRAALKKREKEGVPSNQSFKPILDFSEFEGIEFYKPEKGQNEIDIIPFAITQSWMPYEPGYDDYAVEYWIHYGIGPNNDKVICPRTINKPCPICEERSNLIDQGDKQGADSLKPSKRCIYNVIDRRGDDSEIKIFRDVSWSFFESEIREEASSVFDGDDDPSIYDVELGRTISFRATLEKPWKKGAREFFKFKSFKFLERKPYDRSIIDDAYPLDSFLIFMDYESLSNLFYGIPESSPPDLIPESGPAEAPEPKSEPRERSVRASRAKPEPKPEPEPEPEPDNNQCPSGYEWGVDCNEKDECQTCPDDIFTPCADEQERLKKVEKEEAKEKESPRRGRRRRT